MAVAAHFKMLLDYSPCIGDIKELPQTLLHYTTATAGHTRATAAYHSQLSFSKITTAVHIQIIKCLASFKSVLWKLQLTHGLLQFG